MISKAAGRAESQELDKLFDGLEMPWSSFRDDLRASLDRIVISHKADHGRDGTPSKQRDVTSARLHNDTAYGFTGEVSASGLPIVVHRVPLLSLKPADITDPIRIPDAPLQRALWQATDGLSGKDFEKALTTFSKRDPVFKGIRHVRVREVLSVIPIRDQDGKVFKAYKGSSNAVFQVWQLPNGKWTSKTVSTFDAHQKQAPESRPHPAAKKVLELRQNDTIAIERDGGAREIMLVKQLWPTQIVLVGHKEAGKLDERSKSADDPFKFFAPTAGGLKKIKARQIRINPLGHILDPGPR
jgi:CRISPR-associated endonuclease Csn1